MYEKRGFSKMMELDLNLNYFKHPVMHLVNTLFTECLKYDSTGKQQHTKSLHPNRACIVSFYAT